MLPEISAAEIAAALIALVFVLELAIAVGYLAWLVLVSILGLDTSSIG